jgi:hypothetical protein
LFVCSPDDTNLLPSITRCGKVLYLKCFAALTYCSQVSLAIGERKPTLGSTLFLFPLGTLFRPFHPLLDADTRNYHSSDGRTMLACYDSTYHQCKPHEQDHYVYECAQCRIHFPPLFPEREELKIANRPVNADCEDKEHLRHPLFGALAQLIWTHLANRGAAKHLIKSTLLAPNV